MPTSFDHLVFAATTLEEGLDWFEARTGLRLPAGGKHHLMGTHNCVAALDASTYIELIAIDPQAAKPGRARWFGLDDPAVQAKLAEGPRPLTWVARSPDLMAALAGLRSTGLDGGEALAMSRGTLFWQFGARPDGALLEQGVLPAIIQWPENDEPSEGVHPAARMTPSGLVLQNLHLTHPDPEFLNTALLATGFDAPPDFIEIRRGPHGIQFALTTPNGVNMIV